MMKWAAAIALAMLLEAVAANELRMLILVDKTAPGFYFKSQMSTMMQNMMAGIEYGARQYHDQTNLTANFSIVDVSGNYFDIQEKVLKAIDDFNPCWIDGVYEGTPEQNSLAAMAATARNIPFDVQVDYTGKMVFDNPVNPMYSMAISTGASSSYHFMRGLLAVSKAKNWKRVAILIPTSSMETRSEYNKWFAAAGITARWVSIDMSAANTDDPEAQAAAKEDVKRSLAILRNERYSIIGCALDRMQNKLAYLREFFYETAIDLGLVEKGTQWFFLYGGDTPSSLISISDPATGVRRPAGTRIANHFYQSRMPVTARDWQAMDPKDFPPGQGANPPGDFMALLGTMGAAGGMLAQIPFANWKVEGQDCANNMSMDVMAQFLCAPPTKPGGMFDAFYFFMGVKSVFTLDYIAKAASQGLCGVAAQQSPDTGKKIKELFSKPEMHKQRDDLGRYQLDCGSSDTDPTCKHNLYRRYANPFELCGQHYPPSSGLNYERGSGWISPNGEYFDINHHLGSPMVGDATQDAVRAKMDYMASLPVQFGGSGLSPQNITDILDENVDLYGDYQVRWIGNTTELPRDVLVDTCGERFYVDETTAECVACPRGRGNPLNGTNLCSIPMAEPCPDGAVFSFESLACELCAKGSYAGADACTPCAVGMFAGEDGQKQCTPCPAGSVATMPGTVACTPCSRGNYTVGDDRSQCFSCPSDKTTQEIAASSASECRCLPGMLQIKDGPCEACNEQGADCPGVMQDGSIMSQPGHMLMLAASRRLQASSPMYSEMPRVFRCASAADCPGGESPGDCPPGHRGLACAECEEGFARSEGKCAACSSGGARHALIVVGIAIAVVVVSAGILVSGSLAVKTHASIGFVISNSVGLFVTFNQLTSLAANAPVRWPSFLRFAFDNVALPLTLEPDSSSFTCSMGDMGVSVQILMKFVLVLLAFLLIPAFWMVQRLVVKAKPFTVGNLMNSLGMLVNMAFVPISAQAFGIFNCYPHPDGGASMQQMPAILCFEERWNSEALGPGILCITVAMVIFVTLATVVLRSPSIKDVKAIAFLVARFKPKAYYWNLIMLLRNLLLTVTPIFSSNPFVVISMMSIIVCTYLVALCVVEPWKFVYHNTLDVACSMALLFTFICGTFFSLTTTLPFVENPNTSDWAFLEFLACLPFTGAVLSMLAFVPLGLWYRAKATAERAAAAEKLLQELAAVSRQLCNVMDQAKENSAAEEALMKNMVAIPDFDMKRMSQGSALMAHLIIGAKEGQKSSRISQRVIIEEATDLTEFATAGAAKPRSSDEATCEV